MAAMQEFLASVQQLCSVQSDTESPVDHLPHGHHGLSGWTLGFVKVLAISKTTKKTIVAIRKAQSHIKWEAVYELTTHQCSGAYQNNVFIGVIYLVYSTI